MSGFERRLSALAVASVAAGVVGLAAVGVVTAGTVGFLFGVPFGPVVRLPFLLVVLTVWMPSAAALVLGGVALVSLDPEEDRGKGAAATGIATGAIGLAVFAFFLVVLKAIEPAR